MNTPTVDLASLQGHWLSLGASVQLVFIKPTKDKAHDRLQQPARPRNKSCLEDFPSLSSEKRHTHTHISQGWLPLYKGHQKKEIFGSTFWRMAADPPAKNCKHPLTKGPFQEELLKGWAAGFPRSSVSMCKAFVWSFFLEKSCWAAIFTELWCLQNIFGTGSVNLSFYQSIYLTVKTLLFCLTLWWTYNIETGNPQFLWEIHRLTWDLRFSVYP